MTTAVDRVEQLNKLTKYGRVAWWLSCKVIEVVSLSN